MRTGPAGPAGHRRTATILALLLPMTVVAPPPVVAAGPSTVRVTVEYTSSTGGAAPLARVEVFLWAGGVGRYACTGSDGVARFDDVPAGEGHFVASGVSISALHCRNGEFLQPGTGLKLRMASATVVVPAGRVVTVHLRTGRPPVNQDLVCGGQRPTILGTSASEVLTGTPGDDIISAGGGADVVRGGGGNDWLCGGPGRDTIVGLDGDDILFGEAGDDGGGTRGLRGGLGNDIAYGGTGDDSCVAEWIQSC